MSDTPHPYEQLKDQATTYARLYVRYLRLSTAEKITRFLTASAVAVAGFIFAVICLFFLSLAIAHWIADAIGLGWAYTIIAGFFLLLFGLLFILRKVAVMNPIARFISKLFLQ